MSDINYYGKTIYYVITYIILVSAILLIFDEIFRMTSFCYYYNYNYNYGKISENLCKNDDNNGIVEYEKARYKVLSSLNKYKFEKDLFNKNWINYLNYLIIIIFTILAIVSFGILFYYYYIYNVENCNIDPEEGDMSVIKLLIKCMFGDLHRFIPNCMIDYTILLIIVIIYPLIILLKSFLNIDLTWNSGFWSKGFHILMSILLFSYVLKLLREKTLTIDKTTNKSIPVSMKIKYLKILIYVAFMGLFYLAQYIHLYSYNDYYSQFKTVDIYNNPDDKNDTMFFDIYKQIEPQKPIKPDILINKPKDVSSNNIDLLVSFKYCNQKQLTTTPFPNECLGGSIDNYNKNLNLIDEYYKTKKEYDENMKKYTDKYNIYKNNIINFPEILTIFQGMIPKFLGFDNKIYILIYVMIAIFILIYGIIKFFESDYCDFYYNTVIIYLIGLITIFILTNAILTYNTYFNKYHIYEPISNYKYDLFKMNILFDLSLNNETTQDSENNNKKKLYKEISGNDKKFYNTPPTGSSSISIDTIINEIEKDNLLYNTQSNIIANSNQAKIDDNSLYNFPSSNNNFFLKKLNEYKLYNAIHIGILSELLYLKDIEINDFLYTYISDSAPGTFFWNNSETSNLYKKFLFYYTKPNTSPFYLINSISLEDASSKNLTTNFYTFIQIIKGTAVNNINTIDNKIKRIIDNIEYLVYENYSDDNSINNQRLLLNKTEDTSQNLYKTYLLKESQAKENLGTGYLTSDTNLIKTYKYNLGIISQIGYYYSKFLLKMRDLVIKLFNSSSIYCDSQTVDINIFSKLNEYLNFITTGSKTRRKFKTKEEEPKIEIYKKILINTINDFNDLYFRYFNIIKIIIFNKIVYKDNSNNLNDPIFNEVKSIYNIHAGNEKRYNDNTFINETPIKLLDSNFMNKYKNFNTKQKELLSYNTDNVSWGFVVLVIIFAIILLEPTII